MFKKLTLSIVFALISYASFAQNFSMNFDGSDDEIRITDTSHITLFNDFTFEAWLKTDNLSSGKNIIINKEGEFQIGVVGSDNSISWALANTSPGWYWQTSTAILPANTWTHLAVSIDTQAVKIYINSVLVDSTYVFGYIGDVSPTMNDLTIGWRTANFDTRYSGNMDEVRLWNTIRTKNEIASNMNTELTGNESGLVLYYKFDDSTATCDVIDCAPFAKNGTRNGISGINELPQYADSIPNLIDVACGNNSCFQSNDDGLQIQTAPAIMWYSNENLTTKKFIEDDLQLEIFDAVGRKVNHFQISDKFHHLNLQALNHGIYIAVLRDIKGKHIKVLKFVK